MIFLETRRLYLRNMVAEDAEVMFDYRNHESCFRYQRGQTRDQEEIKKLVRRRKEDRISGEKPFMLAVALKSGNVMIGEIVVKPENRVFSLGYTVSYQYHRQGYALEALAALHTLLHETYPDYEFISYTDPENVPSMGLLRKLGYEDLGYVPSMESRAFGKWLLGDERAEQPEKQEDAERRNICRQINI